MRVFVAGATGVIGRRLVPVLLAGGHEVTGMTRSPGKLEALRALGAEAVLADALDADAVAAALSAARPDAVIDQLTSLPARIDPRRIDRDFAMNDRLRVEGTPILVAAARAAGASRVLAQSIAFAYAPGPAGTVHEEGDPLYLDAPEPFRRSANALHELERTVGEVGGTVLRYGYFYGPGSSISSGGSMATDLARRRLPIVGSGQGVWSFIHVDDAARATVCALDAGRTGVYNVVDDDPAPVARWLPALAEALGAPRPWRVPEWIARPLAGSYGVASMTRAQGASNALAKRELDWTPAYPSWREGFRAALG
ncbi:MAG TPA: NAD(P)-dependent oxidoreductase [Solirubrobacteraceae bacterium]|nr:NAD(P)-dependent oxidoreductase [Solirubrobacteraceae bacterium]